MPTPFPGMDPFLEAIWTDVHTRLVPAFSNLLTPLLAPKYITDLGSRVVVERLPDDDLNGWTVYEAARYDLRIDYTQSPLPPPQSEEEMAWLEA